MKSNQPQKSPQTIFFSLLVCCLAILALARITFVPAYQVQAAAAGQPRLAESDSGAVYVRAVLFWEPDCRFCRQVVEQDLPPLIQPYGQQVQILYIDISGSNAEEVYQAALEQFNVAQSGIPMLVIGQTVLQGSQITQQLPGLIEEHLKAGGVDWPQIPGLERWLDSLPPSMSEPLGSTECTDCELSATQHAAMTTLMFAQRQQATPVASPEHPIARAVMFWMNGCPHCHHVIDTVLPPIQAKYGDQFQLQLIELVGGQEVAALYDLAESMGFAKEDVGVPFLIIGEYALIGSDEIPARLPGLIEQYLAAGGVDFPNSPALAPLLPTHTSEDEICLPSEPCDSATPTPLEPAVPVAQAPTETAAVFPLSAESSMKSNGFTLAIIVMIGMLAAVTYSLYALIKPSPVTLPNRLSPGLEALNLVLILAGLGVAGYLAYVETQTATAICGPVGDCNAVQQSPYARLFGILPIGVLGMAGYLAILAAWVVRRTGQARWANLAALAILGMTLGGTLFSFYLTYLEPFVIKAVCLWCVSSAVIMTLLLLLNVKPAKQALSQRHEQDKSSVQ